MKYTSKVPGYDWQDIEFADSLEEAVSQTEWEVQDSFAAWAPSIIPVDIASIEEDEDGYPLEQTTIHVAVDSAEPECIDGQSHKWGETTSWGGSGATVYQHTTCIRCGIERQAECNAQSDCDGEATEFTLHTYTKPETV